MATTKIGDAKPKDLNTMSIVSKNTSQHKDSANYVPDARHCSKCFFSHCNLLNFWDALMRLSHNEESDIQRF